MQKYKEGNIFLYKNHKVCLCEDLVHQNIVFEYVESIGNYLSKKPGRVEDYESRYTNMYYYCKPNELRSADYEIKDTDTDYQKALKEALNETSETINNSI